MTSCSAPRTPKRSVFYDRHVKSLLGYFARRTRDPEVAADLTAETFASALVARRRFKPGGAPAAAWLFAIAARRLADYQRRGRVEQRMRRSLEMERRAVSEADAEMIRLLGDDAAESMLAELPPEQRRPDRGARDRGAVLRRARGRAGTPQRRPCASASRAACRRCAGARGHADERLRHRACGCDLVEAAERQAHRGHAWLGCGARCTRARGRRRRWPARRRCGGGGRRGHHAHHARAPAEAVEREDRRHGPPRRPAARRGAGGRVAVDRRFRGPGAATRPGHRRVRARISVSGSAIAVAADGDVVWVMTNDDTSDRVASVQAQRPQRPDPRPGARGGSAGRIDAGAGGLWLFPDRHRGDVERIDPESSSAPRYVPRSGSRLTQA